MLAFFGETEASKAHGKLLGALEDFFERRNGIAHALNPGQSSGSQQIITDLDMLQAFSEAMFQTLDDLAPGRTTPLSPPTAVVALTPETAPAQASSLAPNAPVPFLSPDDTFAPDAPSVDVEEPPQPIPRKNYFNRFNFTSKRIKSLIEKKLKI
jgi:hypothetical protein